MSTVLLRHFSFLATSLECFQDIQSGFGVNEILHLLIALLNFSLEKGGHIIIYIDRISSKMSRFIKQFCAELNF